MDRLDDSVYARESVMFTNIAIKSLLTCKSIRSSVVLPISDEIGVKIRLGLHMQLLSPLWDKPDLVYPITIWGVAIKPFVCHSQKTISCLPLVKKIFKSFVFSNFQAISTPYLA